MRKIPTPEDVWVAREERRVKKEAIVKLFVERAAPIFRDYLVGSLLCGDTCVKEEFVKSHVLGEVGGWYGIDALIRAVEPEFFAMGWRLEIRGWCNPSGSALCLVEVGGDGEDKGGGGGSDVAGKCSVKDRKRHWWDFV